MSGRPIKGFRVGVNYWPRHRGVAMWRDWHPEEIAAEFQEMADLGLNTARIFLTWNDFQPIKEIYGYQGQDPPLQVGLRSDSCGEEEYEEEYPELVNPIMIARFEELLRIARGKGIMLIPTLLVGWMSGVVFDVDFRKERNIFSDPTMLKYQMNYVSYFARRYKDEEVILAWDLGNEQNCFMECPSRDAAWLWTYMLTEAIRRHDPNHPITSGMHGLGISLGGVKEGNNFLIRDVAEQVDFLTVHPYQAFVPVKNYEPPHFFRNTYIPAWQSRLYQGIGKKRVLCEEVGSLGRSFMSLDVEAKLARTILYSMVANYDLGVLWWCHTDFTCKNESPYEFCLMENDGLGLFDEKGNPKPVAQEFANFARVMQKIPWEEVEPAEREAAIVVPWQQEAHLEVFSAFVLCKQAGIEAEIIRPEDDFKKYKLIILPALSGFSPFKRSQWERIIGFVKEGGVLYLSYNGASLPQMEELFGFRLQYRWQELKTAHKIYVRTEEFGLKLGEELIYQGKPSSSLRICAERGEVLGVEEEGEPVLIRNRFGLGQAIFCALPLEILLHSRGVDYLRDKSYKIYRYLKGAARLKDVVTIDHPALERVVHNWDGKKLLVVVNHGLDKEKFYLQIENPYLTKGYDLIREKEQGVIKGLEVELEGNSGGIYVLY